MVQLQERTTATPVLTAVQRGTAALLCIGVAIVHVIDQGGFPGSKSPTYIAVGYYLLEIAGIVIALLLARSGAPTVWLLTLGVAAGPLLGFILSRGPGLPNYSDDKGNWTEPIGVASLVIEACLLALAALNLFPTLTARKSAV
jgi:hypothetical protein